MGASGRESQDGGTLPAVLGLPDGLSRLCGPSRFLQPLVGQKPATEVKEA